MHPSPELATIRWHLLPAYQQLAQAELTSTRWLQPPDAQVVKDGPHRTVWRVRVGDLVLYCKRCKIWNLRAWLRQWLRPAKARIEFDKSQEMRQRGIPTYEPVGWGRRHWLWPSESYLLTVERPNAVPLDLYIEQILPSESVVRQYQLAEELGRFVAFLHDQGVLHHDLHPGNLLVEVGSSFRFFVLDLHAIELGPPLTDRQAQDNLVVFNRYFSLRTTLTQRLRFWRAYCQARLTGTLDPRSACKRIEARTLRSNLALWRAREKRCQREGRQFYVVGGQAACGYAVRDLDSALAARLARDPDAPFTAPDARWLKDSRSSTVVELMLDGRPVVYKRFRVTKWTDPLANCVRRSAALRSWIMGHAMLDRQLPTPRPLLLLQRYRWGMPAEGYVLFERVTGQDLHACIAAGWPRGLEQRLGRLLARMHRSGLSHRDLKASNILFDPAKGQFHILDLVGMDSPGRLSKRRCIRDLMRLAVSLGPSVRRSVRLRFLLAYLLAYLGDRSEWKWWWRQIDRAGTAKRNRNARRNRPLH